MEHTNNEERSYNHCCSEKAGSTAYSEGAFLALVIQHVTGMRHIVICVLPGSTILSHKGMIFEREKKLLNTKCVVRLPLQLLSETFPILRRNERDMIKNL